MGDGIIIKQLMKCVQSTRIQLSKNPAKKVLNQNRPPASFSTNEKKKKVLGAIATFASHPKEYSGIEISYKLLKETLKSR